MRDLMGERVPGLVSQRKKRLKVQPDTPFGEAAALLTGLKGGHKKNRKPIRTLIDDYGETLSDVMPCFLMSGSMASCQLQKAKNSMPCFLYWRISSSKVATCSPRQS